MLFQGGQGGQDNCIQEAIQQIEQHATCLVEDPSYEIPLNVFRLRQAQFKVCGSILTHYIEFLPARNFFCICRTNITLSGKVPQSDGEKVSQSVESRLLILLRGYIM
jgi:hypothetical protein